MHICLHAYTHNNVYINAFYTNCLILTYVIDRHTCVHTCKYAYMNNAYINAFYADRLIFTYVIGRHIRTCI